MSSNQGYKVHRHSSLSIAYRVYGAGNQVVLAFHGYGQSGRVWEEFLPGNEYTIYAFDLPFHGDSPLASDEEVALGLSKKGLAESIVDFLNEIGVEQVMLLGYSMGARIALSLLEQMNDRVASCHVIAPDGLYLGHWYRFSVRTSIGRATFRRLPAYYSTIQGLTRRLSKVGLLHEHLHNLVLRHTATAAHCNQLYNSWVFLRYIWPDQAALSARSGLQSIPTFIHLGQRDRIIQMRRVLNSRLVRSKAPAIYQYNLGHGLLVEEVFNVIKASPHLHGKNWIQ